MADHAFEDELLQVARWSKQTPAREGGTSRGGRSRRQNATVASSSEDESDRGRDEDDDEMEREDISEREEEETPEEDADADNDKNVGEDEDSSDDGGRRRLKKKPGATGPKRVPMKKRNNKNGGSNRRRRARSDSEEDDDDDDNDGDDDADKDGYNSELSFGSDLYKDKEDRRNLMALTELEREMILHERGERRDNYLERRGRQQKQQRPEEIEQEQKKRTKKAGGRQDHKNREQERERDRDRDRGMMSGARDAEEEEEDDEGGRDWERDKEREERPERQSTAPPQRSRVAGGELSSALQALAKKRRAANEKRGRRSPRSRRIKSPSVGSSSEGSEQEEEEEDRSTSDASLSRSPHSRSRSRSRSRGRSEPLDSDEDERRRPEPEAEFADLQRVVIRRSMLAKWFMEPFFEDTITGCLVRLLVGADANNNAQYRLVEVVGVDARDSSKSYTFENRMTCKFLDVKFGEKNARWQMTQVSNSPVLEKEVRDWFKELDRVGLGRWTVADVEEKCQAIAKVAQFKYTSEAVRRMVEEKRQTAAMEGQRPRNVAMERDRLHKALDIAAEGGDQDEAERLQGQLKELEAFTMAAQMKETKAVRLANMNKRNKAENFQNSGADAAPGDNKDGQADLHDPFSRRWTRSQNYYKKPDLNLDEEEKDLDETIKSDKADDVAEEKGEEVPAEEVAGDLLEGSLVDTAFHVEEEVPKVVAVHKFELAINLDVLERFGYASGVAKGIMARKRKLEAVYGVQVPPLDPRQRRVKLTIDDYQRRQQLK